MTMKNPTEVEVNNAACEATENNTPPSLLGTLNDISGMELVSKVANMIDRHPERHSQYDWSDEIDYDVCETRHCFGGWAKALRGEYLYINNGEEYLAYWWSVDSQEWTTVFPEAETSEILFPETTYLAGKGFNIFRVRPDIIKEDGYSTEIELDNPKAFAGHLKDLVSGKATMLQGGFISYEKDVA